MTVAEYRKCIRCEQVQPAAEFMRDGCAQSRRCHACRRERDRIRAGERRAKVMHPSLLTQAGLSRTMLERVAKAFWLARSIEELNDGQVLPEAEHGSLAP